MTTATPTWRQAWDFDPPAPGDADFIAERAAEPSAYERDLRRRISANLRRRAGSETPLTPAESIRLRQEAMDLGAEAQRLWRERTGRL
jgi:hypothetical protein